MSANNLNPIGYAYHREIHSNHNYLLRALARLAPVQFLGSSNEGKPAYHAHSSVSEVLPLNGAELRAHIFSDSAVWRGIETMDCTTALMLYDQWPGDYDRIALGALADVVFTSGDNCLDEHRAAGWRHVNFLHYACEPEIHEDMKLERVFEVGFVGNTTGAHHGHRERRRILSEMSARFRMNDYRRWTFLRDMARIYSQSKIVINLCERKGFNMRVYESMACGALLVTEDIGHGQDMYFKEGVHYVLYRNEREMMDKIAYYLAHDDERQRIAACGQREVLAHHTYDHRAREMLKVLDAVTKGSGRSRDPNAVAKAYIIHYGRRLRPDLLASYLCRAGVSLRWRLDAFLRLVKALILLARQQR